MPPAEPEDEAARLYDSLGEALYRYASMILADREAAEDAVQQVFAALVARGLRGVSDPERYLRRAVRNACYSLLRQRSSRGTPVAGSSDADFLEAVPGNADPVSHEIRIALAAAIGDLPGEQREVLHLHVFEGRTFRESAETIGESPSTVASRYRYALAKLRQTLSG